MTPLTYCVCLLWVVAGLWLGCGWSDNHGSVEQPTRFTLSGTYGRIGNKKENLKYLCINIRHFVTLFLIIGVFLFPKLQVIR